MRDEADRLDPGKQLKIIGEFMQVAFGHCAAQPEI
jgi:hypothetical protein